MARQIGRETFFVARAKRSDFLWPASILAAVGRACTVSLTASRLSYSSRLACRINVSALCLYLTLPLVPVRCRFADPVFLVLLTSCSRNATACLNASCAQAAVITLAVPPAYGIVFDCVPSIPLRCAAAPCFLMAAQSNAFCECTAVLLTQLVHSHPRADVAVPNTVLSIMGPQVL